MRRSGENLSAPDLLLIDIFNYPLIDLEPEDPVHSQEGIGLLSGADQEWIRSGLVSSLS